MVSGLATSIVKGKYCYLLKVENGRDVSMFREDFINAGKHWNFVQQAAFKPVSQGL